MENKINNFDFKLSRSGIYKYLLSLLSVLLLLYIIPSSFLVFGSLGLGIFFLILKRKEYARYALISFFTFILFFLSVQLISNSFAIYYSCSLMIPVPSNVYSMPAPLNLNSNCTEQNSNIKAKILNSFKEYENYHMVSVSLKDSYLDLFKIIYLPVTGTVILMHGIMYLIFRPRKKINNIDSELPLQEKKSYFKTFGSTWFLFFLPFLLFLLFYVGGMIYYYFLSESNEEYRDKLYQEAPCVDLPQAPCSYPETKKEPNIDDNLNKITKNNSNFTKYTSFVAGGGVGFELEYPKILIPKEVFGKEGYLSRVDFVLPELSYVDGYAKETEQEGADKRKVAKNVIVATLYIVDADVFKKKYIDFKPIFDESGEKETIWTPDNNEGVYSDCEVDSFYEFKCGHFILSGYITKNLFPVYILDKQQQVGSSLSINYDLEFAYKKRIGILFDGPHLLVNPYFSDLQPNIDEFTFDLKNLKFFE